MALFGFFKRTTKPSGFHYKPRFVEQPKGELQERLKEVLERAESNGGDPVSMKERIRKGLGRKSSYLADQKYRQKRLVRSNLLLLLIIVALVVATFAVLELYLPEFLKFLG